MATYTDHTGREVVLYKPPKRIVSTVPSQTELLFDLGLDVVGITAFCVHPRQLLQEKTVIGGTKDLQIQKIRELQPDLIIGNKEENEREQIEELAEDFPVWISDVTTVEDALDMIRSVGQLTGTGAKSSALLQQIEDERKIIPENLPPLRTAYFIWKDPYMIASGDTFIQAMLSQYGFENIALKKEGRYPQLKLEELAGYKPDVLFLSSEPYPFKVADMHEIAQSFPGTFIKIVDGEMLSWYGSRLLKGLRYLKLLRNEANLTFSLKLSDNY